MKPLSGKVTEEAHKTMRIIGAEYDMNLGQVVEGLVCFHNHVKNNKPSHQTTDEINHAWELALGVAKNQSR